MDAIDTRKRKSGSIEGLLNDYLSKFKVFNSPQLFDTSDFLELLRKGKCPICTCKLYLTKKGAGYCKSVKHKKFFISSAKLKSII